ncbi:WbqC family protein [Butyrivibrio sp. XBB1001]|uniref:WbqC family protein n=1 Tax=Butyrivibrio sp. XBB1001 TaxID=1280682 RepID=UPI0004109DB5|nr:WbqC family protein [Butyrivibrio sp. XBB1001]
MSSKKLGIMQPYFFPYIGYFQLINAVDEHIIYDDVNFIKGGWINRNRILVNGEPSYINVQLSKASPNKLINELSIYPDSRLQKKLLLTLESNYKKAPYFEVIYPFLEEMISTMDGQLSTFLAECLKAVCNYLGIQTTILLSSELEKDSSLKSEAKVIDICKRRDADIYINAIGGQHLYDYSHFASNGITLRFINSAPIVYKQFDNDFCPNLSIIDVMMFNSVETIKKYLDSYTLI